MSKRYSMRACIKGHVDTSCQELSCNTAKFCEKCGAVIIDKCQNCGARIPGSYEGIITFGPDIPPQFCDSCGKSHPWTTRSEMFNKINDMVKTSDIGNPEKLEINEKLQKLSRNELTEDEQVSLAKKIRKYSKQLGDRAYSEAKDILTEAMAKAAVKIFKSE